MEVSATVLLVSASACIIIGMFLGRVVSTLLVFEKSKASSVSPPLPRSGDVHIQRNNSDEQGSEDRQLNAQKPMKILVSAFWKELLVRVTDRVKEEYPLWTVTLDQSQTKSFNEQLLTGEFDAAIVCGWDQVSPQMLDTLFEPQNGGRLKAICSTSSGVNRIDLPKCREYGVTVTNAAKALADSCADYLLCLILMTVRNVPQHMADLREGVFSQKLSDSFSITAHCSKRDLHHSKVGIVGCGNIGQALAKRLQGFDCRVVYRNRKRLPPAVEKQLHVHYEAFEELLATSDVVVCLCPLNKTTEGMFGAREFAMMKDTAVFINGGRGKLCSTDDLMQALDSGEIHGAGLDVTDPEPLPTTHPLLAMRNCIVTPHALTNSVPCREAMIDIATDSVIRALTGKTLQVQVK